MEKRKTTSTDSLVFAVNGERFELPTVDPSTTVLEFLRTKTRFKGVKLCCGEGGCGACVVLLSKYDPVLKQVEDFVVNSCLTLLCSVNGCSINTTEGLGNSKDGFHPIHQRFAGFHASQCGFCTPGMCVSLFSALVNAEKTHRPEPPTGFSKLTVSEAEKAIAGNLCRCTGYRPIADVCKSFAANVDIEDLGFNSFWKKGESKEVKISRLPFYDPKQQICTYPEFLKTEQNYVTLLDPNRYSWYTPVTIEMLHSLLELSEFEKHLRIKLVAGNTGTGYYKELEHYDKYIDLRHAPELSIIKRSHTGIEIGSTVTISKAILALRKESNCVFEKLADHMEMIASVAIRDTATVGGNLVMAQRNSFPSDLATILLAAGSTLTIVTGLKNEKVTMEEFLKMPALDSRSVLLSIQIPCWQPINDGFSAEMHSKLLFETYRAASRPLGNALAYLNASFLAVVSPCKTGIVVKKIQLAFGAYGTKHAIRAGKVEEYLAEKILSVSVIYESLKLIKETVLPEYGTSNPAYRASLAVGFLFQFLFPLVDVGNMVSDGQLDGYTANFPERPSKMKYGHNNFGHVEDPVLLSSGKQEVELSSEYHPVGEPIIKSGSALQASGEAVYVDDIPSPTNCLYGAFIYSTKPLARIKSINVKSRDIPEGVTDIISYKDIPNGGENVGSKSIFGYESLFADDITDCAGQRIAFVVADTQKSADIAANMAVVEYDTEILEPPILTVEEAVERSSFFPTVLYPEQVGDFSKGLAEADHKILSAKIELGSQYYFYMETQTALAIPDEDDCMVVYSSTQCPENAHIVFARCLGIPEHNIRVITRRVGGGFGGKAIRSIPAAAACALAAHKLRRPVRIYLNRKTDMIMAGGRHPMKITYTVGFKSNGKITALHLDILINAGMSADISPIMPHNVMNPLKKYDWGALSFDIKVCKTNHTSKSAMRAPGEVQGSFIAEAVMENVASVLLMEVDSIRSINLHTFNSLNIFYKGIAGNLVDYTLPSIWNKLAQSSSFIQRKEFIKQFNHSNTWLKKGISRVPIVHGVMQRATPGKVSILGDGSVAVEVGGIEIGQGLWTKVKQMTAFALSLIQCDGAESLLDKVRVIQSDTLSLIQGGFTSGSTTSESSCEAVRLCCNILVERLLPLKKKLMEQMDAVKWDYLIQQANLESVSLSASSYFVPEMTAGQYLNYGAAVSEVEINILTGETRILQADIIYDCGQSLNPAVDLGQIEGAFIQGIGFFMFEEYLANSDGLVVADGTWTYKIPTIDTIPKQFNVHVVNSGHHKNRILSSKASGEAPLLLAVSVYCAARSAIIEARKQLISWSGRLENPDSTFQLKVPATLPVVKEFCGLDSVERYLESLLLR